MSLRIDQDHRRFREIVRGKIKQNLRKYITQGEMLGKKGKEVVSIPLPQIDIPHFRFGSKQTGGVGQGDGDPGDALGQGDPQAGSGKAGDRPGEHLLEVDVTMEELAQILGEELQLPRIEPKGKQRIVARKDRYTGIRNTGPESLRHFRRTFKQALRRQIAMGSYDPKNPMIVPVREDKRYRSWRSDPLPQSNAVIIYMMDVSGSMGDEQKEIVRIESFWIDTWLRSQYQGIESRYIIHDAMAKEVDRETFFRTRESGGTMISSAYKLCAKLIDDEYPPSEWNIYPFHFSDGDNWSVDDTVTCIELLKSGILPKVNLFCYGQVESPYGSGQFIKDLQEHFDDKGNLTTSEIKGKEAIMDSIREFLGKGK
jgi:sporulation protein YhbH